MVRKGKGYLGQNILCHTDTHKSDRRKYERRRGGNLVSVSMIVAITNNEARESQRRLPFLCGNDKQKEIEIYIMP